MKELVERLEQSVTIAGREEHLHGSAIYVYSSGKMADGEEFDLRRNDVELSCWHS